MDLPPLRPTAIPGMTGPANASQEKIAEGRLFQAQVVQLGDGGSLVLAVGRERIAATSQAGFQVGQRLFLRVKGSGAARVFELLGEAEFAALAEPAAPVDSESHPFRLLAQAAGVGSLLAELEARLGEARSDARSLGSFAFAPGGDADQLARSLARGGLGHETLRLARALEQLPQAVLVSTAEELLGAALAAAPDPRAARAELARLLGSALEGPQFAAALAEPRLQAGERAPPFTRLLLALGSLLDGLPSEPFPAAVREDLRDLIAVARISPALARAVSEALLGEGRSGALAKILTELASESALPPAFPPTLPPTLPPGGEVLDLKQWLLSALEKGQDGLEPSGRPTHALRGALAALEAEQFVALARSQAGEGQCLAFALRDGSRFADAHLIHRRLDDSEGDERSAERGPRRPSRAVLGLDFSRTGPVRAEFLLDASNLRVRLDVGSEAVAGRLHAGLEALRERLAANGRNVQVQVGVRPLEDLRVPGPDSDLRLAGGRGAVDRLG
ncbi:MAG: flagellar hook-length control protein FliK [Planctomycetes bacterium]|nr:flagellar hook-length control protein FliK [Planctomycetota bacterium]